MTFSSRLISSVFTINNDAGFSDLCDMRHDIDDDDDDCDDGGDGNNDVDDDNDNNCYYYYYYYYCYFLLLRFLSDFY